jgi:hypothetical protein
MTRRSKAVTPTPNAISRSTIILLIAASGIDSAVAVLSLTKGDNKRLITILTTASNALRDYVNQVTK